jgi:uncharacterized membrane protein (DUF4010 family)
MPSNPQIQIDMAFWVPTAESLLIGLLVGAQRESARRANPEEGEERAGLRDFVLIAAIGSTCGFLQLPWLTSAACLAIVGLLVALRFPVHTHLGYTTELAALAVFCLTYATSMPGHTDGTLTISVAVILTLFLEARRHIHRFFRETLTETEFNDTLRFLALILVIYPILPDDHFGPYGFFNPRQVWLFVLMVSTISYLGYFFEKFLGERRGLWITSILGGLASTTAATSAFAQDVREQPARVPEYWQAATVANAIQFPRILALIAFMSVTLARAAALPLLLMTAAGLVMAFFTGSRPRTAQAAEGARRVEVRNPFSFLPALKFGALFTAILFFAKAASAEFGSQALLWTSVVGGLLDVDSIAVASAQLFNSASATRQLSVAAVLIALLMNAVFKTGIAWTTAGRAFGLRVAASFLVMLLAGAAALPFL